MPATKITGDSAIQISTLLDSLERARDKEKAAKSEREALEFQIATVLGVPDTWAGSKAFRCGDWKMTARRSMNIKVDNEVFAPIQAKNPELAERFFRTKIELNKAEWSDATEDEKQVFIPAITSTPGKVSIVADKNLK